MNAWLALATEQEWRDAWNVYIPDRFFKEYPSPFFLERQSKTLKTIKAGLNRYLQGTLYAALFCDKKRVAEQRLWLQLVRLVKSVQYDDTRMPVLASELIRQEMDELLANCQEAYGEDLDYKMSEYLDIDRWSSNPDRERIQAFRDLEGWFRSSGETSTHDSKEYGSEIMQWSESDYHGPDGDFLALHVWAKAYYQAQIGFMQEVQRKFASLVEEIAHAN